MKKRAISFFCALALLFGSFAWMFPARAAAADDENSVLISESEIPLRLWYDEEAPKINEHSPHAPVTGYDEGWQQWSLPIGNGYFGANVFGRTVTERIQITEKTLANKRAKPEGYDDSYGGLNNFSETFIDFGHTDVSDYIRYLDMNTAISGVEYTYGGVKYSREHFTSYPDKALVIKLDADTAGALSFTLRPTIPYEQSYMVVEGDGYGKSGTVTSEVKDGIGYIELAGKLEYYDVDFLGIYKVYTDGGTVTASTTQHTYNDTDGTSITDTDGTIAVNGANSAYIVVTLGTDYELSSEVFTTSDKNKPTFNTDLQDTRVKVETYMNAIDAKIAGKSFNEAYDVLKEAHVADHSELFGRVTLDLGCNEADFAVTTDELLESYKSGYKSTYLETLLFQYGRYQLIASSRAGALPANLQGVWNTYNSPEWGSGYWHNINVQMNYWPAFSTNLTETFEAYVAFNEAFMQKAEANATSNVSKYNPDMLDADGGNGWVIGTGNYAYSISSDRSAGNLGFTTQLYWEYYQYTQDETILKEIVLPKLLSAARYITKCVEIDEDGNYLVSYSDSPEVHVNGVWYYTVGTTYAQTFAYLNNYHTLLLAEEAGIDLTDEALLSTEEYSVLKTVMEQIDKYDPIHVGLSGQIKEFREEDYYGSVGDDPSHRHISQLVGLYPGNIINSNTPAWIDAALVTLDGRGENTTGGWVYAHKAGLYARAKDGDQARERVDELLSRVTFPNLFTRLWGVYQIDASLGVTAGMAEMLLQSNSGYIEPLAALPANWSEGSYTGLCAEGGFEVSTIWENGTAKTLNVLSKTGNEAAILYYSIDKATVVKASNGARVAYTVDENNAIRFATEAGETYIISGFTPAEKIDAPQVLNYSRAEEFGDFNLVWSPVEGADSYNVSVAIENSATYSLIANTESTSITYTPANEDANARMTFVVTAVKGDTESKRTLCYSNPIDTAASIDKIRGYVLESDELQVVIKANGNTAKYRLYEKNTNGDGYTLISESMAPVLTAADYSDGKSYAVSVISYYQAEESELIEVTYITSSSAIVNENVFKDKIFVESTDKKATPTTGYEYSKLTDGIIDTSNSKNGRFSTKKTAAATDTEPNPAVTQYAEATIDLERDYMLTELRFYLYNKTKAQAGTNFTIEVYSNGEWIPVYANLTNEELQAKYIKVNDSTKSGTWLVFELGGISGSKLRFHSDPLPGDTVTFYEAECYGSVVEESVSNVLTGQAITGSEPSFVHDTQGDIFTYDKLIDGIISTDWKVGRYSSQKNGKFAATIEFDKVYLLDTFKIYTFSNLLSNAGDNWVFEVYLDGKWTTVKTVTNAELGESLVSNGGSAADSEWYEVDLGKAAAEKLRISAKATTGNYVTLTEIKCSATSAETFAVYSDNILEGFEFIGSQPVANDTTYNYDKLTDGVISKTSSVGRYSSKKSGAFEATLEFDGVYLLNNLKLYAFNKAYINTGENWKFEVYFDGAWRTFKTIATNDELAAFKVSNGGTGVEDEWIEINLSGVAAEKIRFSATALSNQYVTLTEIRCTGYAMTTAPADRSEMITAYEKLSELNISSDDHNAKMADFRDYLTDLKLTEEKAIAYTEEMNAYYETAKKDALNSSGYVPKISITLDSSIVMNIYVPKDDTLEFTLDGTSYTDLSLLESQIVTIGGKDFYRMQVTLDAKSAARTVSLAVKIPFGDSTATGRFSFSVTKYANSIFASGTEVEKQILRDVLSYIRAAYNYFDSDTDGTIEKINAIIGERYDETAPYTAEGSTEAPSMGLSSVTFALTSTPALKFCIDGSAPAEAYEFFIGGRRLNAEVITDGDKTYIVLDIYAYAMCETITYKINGEYAGSYHIASYHNWAKAQNNEKLTSLVERFWKYCQSARDFKNSVVVTVNFTDESGKSLANSKSMRLAVGTEFSVPSPAVSGYYTRDLYIKGTADENENINVVYKAIPQNVNKEVVSQKLSNIVCWGDSITAGSGGSNITAANEYGIDLVALGGAASGTNYVNTLKNLISQKIYGGINVANCGVGGETSATIASRADTETYYLYLDGAVSISDFPVVIPLAQSSLVGRLGILRQGNASTLNPITIVGKNSFGEEISVSGSISMALKADAPSGTNVMTCDYSLLEYTFTRTDGDTDTLDFVSGARVITSSSYVYDGRTCIIFMGENGGYTNFDELIKQQVEILTACGNPEYFLIISSTSGTTESRKAITEALTERWGDRYINMGNELNSKEDSYRFAGYSEEDIVSVQANIIEGSVSTLLIADRCHPNAIGYAVIGNIIFERLFDIGAFDAIFDYYDSLAF